MQDEFYRVILIQPRKLVRVISDNNTQIRL